MREDLRQFDMECLDEMRRIMEDRHGCAGPVKDFLDELKKILSMGTVSCKWVKKPKEGIVKGDVWECPIGQFYHKRTLHRFAYLYAEYDPKQEVVIDSHGHEEKGTDKEPFHGGKQVKKVKEWYIFPDGKVEFCDKDELHQLINNYGKPIYVISVKSMSNATH